MKVGSVPRDLSLEITVCDHSASLVMPNGDPWDGIFYPILTLMIDSYIGLNSNIYLYFAYANSKPLARLRSGIDSTEP